MSNEAALKNYEFEQEKLEESGITEAEIEDAKDQMIADCAEHLSAGAVLEIIHNNIILIPENLPDNPRKCTMDDFVMCHSFVNELIKGMKDSIPDENAFNYAKEQRA